MSNTTVSIILVNWNGREDTAECLGSLEVIDYPNHEIIVVDNASTDNSHEYLKTHFPHVVLIENNKNEGFGKANNIGMRWCLRNNSSAYFFLLNNDTRVKQDALSRLVDTAESSNDIGVVSPKIYFMENAQAIWFAGGEFNFKRGSARVIGVHELDKGQHDNKRMISFATGCAMLVKRSVIETVGLFDERYFLYEEDVEFSIRITKAGYKIVYEPKAIVYHRANASIRKSDEFLGILSAKNSNAHIYYYYLVRNRLFTMRKHANIYQWATFLPYFFLYWIYKAIGAASVGNYKAMASIIRGIKAFFNIPKDHKSS